MGKKTSLYACHTKANAKIVDFAGWDMPLNYGSQVEEHHLVRNDAGVFDVSHMTIVDIKGIEATNFLSYMFANNVAKLIPGKALYTCMLNEAGGVIDDLIVYKVEDNFYRTIVNSGTRDKDIAWFKKHAENFEVSLDERTKLAMLAIQGPNARQKLASLIDFKILDLKPFNFIIHDEFFVACTGYTGEDGFEVIVPQDLAEGFWQRLLEAGIKPCGLGARDTLRLEAGFNLYGSDMDENVTPLESNLSWTVSFKPEDRDFIGRKALETQKAAGVEKNLVGLSLEGKGVLRNHQKVYSNGIEQGEITSGSFSPTLGKGIAFARLPKGLPEKCEVDIRGSKVPVKIISLPFVKATKKNENSKTTV